MTLERTAPPVAIVTGAAQGIGRGITQTLLRAGITVVMADCDAEAGEEALQAFKPEGDVHSVRCDVSDEAQVMGLVEESVRTLGRLDYLVNNAGVGLHEPLETLSLRDWQRVLNINLTAPMLLTKHAAPHLRAARGAVVNIASTRALMSEKDSEAYAASKGGLVALTHALAISLSPDVRVNCISPGWIDVRPYKKAAEREDSPLSPKDHAQHPVGRVGTPEDIASMTLYLLRDGGFITGQNFTIDGGMTRKMIYG